jgi:transducin (beta)-like 1
MKVIRRSSFDGTARLWDSVTGDCLKVFMDHKRPLYTLSFSPDGYWLATGSGDGWLHIYNCEVSRFQRHGLFVAHSLPVDENEEMVLVCWN